MSKILAEDSVTVVMENPNFDVACIYARKNAILKFGIDEDGYCEIEDFDRTDCFVHVTFNKLIIANNIHLYEFDIKIVKNTEIT